LFFQNLKNIKNISEDQARNKKLKMKEQGNEKKISLYARLTLKTINTGALLIHP